MIVICINNCDNTLSLTVDKEYLIKEETEEEYLIENDNGNENFYFKSRFKEVEPQKEVKKEYSVMEVLQMPKGTILKLFPYDESEREIIVSEGIAKNKYLYYMDNDKCTNEAVIISSWIMDKPRFTKVEEPKLVSTAEAFKALEEGNIIQSNKKYRYKKIKGIIMVETDVTIAEGRGFVKFTYIGSEELEGQWIIL